MGSSCGKKAVVPEKEIVTTPEKQINTQPDNPNSEIPSVKASAIPETPTPVTKTFEEWCLHYINLFRSDRNSFIDFLNELEPKLQQNMQSVPPYEKIMYQQWKYRIPLGSFAHLKNFAKNLPKLNPLEINDDIKIPSKQSNDYNFMIESNKVHEKAKFDNSFLTNISDPKFAIIIHCLVDNRIPNEFDCGKYDVFNKEGKYVGIEGNNKEGKEFMATFAFKSE